MRRIRAFPLLRFLIVLLCPLAIDALQPSLEITQYAHTAWNIRDGFLKGAVRSITQTPDGYLWLATEFGLVRFDGVQFVSWVPPLGEKLPSSNIRSVLASRDGTLWIGTLEGLASWKDSKLTQYAEFAGANVLALLEDREGTIWAGSFGIPKGKLCSIEHGKVACYAEDGSLGEWVWSLYEDEQGRVWAGAQSGLWQWKPGPPKRYTMAHPIETAQALVQDDNGLLAVAESIWQLKNDRIEGYPFDTFGGRLTPVNLFRDRDHGLWVGTMQRGVFRIYRGKISAFSQSDGLSNDRVQSFFEDREGNIWVGTLDGLDRFRETAVSSISVKEGLSSPSVWAVLVAHDNSVWMSTLDGLNRWNNGNVTVYRTKDDATKEGPHSLSPAKTAQHAVTEITDPGLPDNVGSLYEDGQGRIWVSSPDGIVRLEAGRFRRLRELPGGWVNAIAGDGHDGVWISYQDQGLVHWGEGKVIEKVPWPHFGSNVVASAIVPDAKLGGLWIGFFQGGLVHFQNGQVRASYGKNEGMGAGRVMGTQEDSDGTIWAATEGGLTRLKDGHIINLNVANGLPCNTVHWVAEVEDSFWLYTACGLIRISRLELEKWSANPVRTLQLTVFDSSDGVRSHSLLTGYTPRVSKSGDGKLWFTRIDGASVVDPNHLRLNKIPPPVKIERITANGKIYDAVTGLRLPALVRDLAADYTALSLTAPDKMQFRVKLEGQDHDWREPVNPRHAHYTNLSPKRYRLLVKASNNSGVWNEQGAALEFEILPAWYQTNWFRAIGVAACLLLLWAIYQLRLRQLAQHFHMRLEERVGERTRIARDLHDTLLQSFHGVLLYFQTGINLLPEHPADARKTLEKAMHQAKSAIVEGRQAIQGLRSSVVETNDLAAAIRTLGEELAADANSFQVLVEGTPRNLHPILRDEVYRVVGEGLRNAIRHADAKRIEVEIYYDEGQFRVRVRDDGKGIDPNRMEDNETEGHFGLRGMRERAKLSGGKLTVWSQRNSGTEVELSIPAGRAYAATEELERMPLTQKIINKFSSWIRMKKA